MLSPPSGLKEINGFDTPAVSLVNEETTHSSYPASVFLMTSKITGLISCSRAIDVRAIFASSDR